MGVIALYLIKTIACKVEFAIYLILIWAFVVKHDFRFLVYQLCKFAYLAHQTTYFLSLTPKPHFKKVLYSIPPQEKNKRGARQAKYACASAGIFKGCGQN